MRNELKRHRAKERKKRRNHKTIPIQLLQRLYLQPFGGFSNTKNPKRPPISAELHHLTAAGVPFLLKAVALPTSSSLPVAVPFALFHSFPSLFFLYFVL